MNCTNTVDKVTWHGTAFPNLRGESKPFCNILLYSKVLNVFSQWSSSPTPAAKKAPHTMTLFLILHCGRGAFIIIFLTRFSKTPIWSIWLHHITRVSLIHHSTQLCWTNLIQTSHILPKTSLCLWWFSKTAMAF